MHKFKLVKKKNGTRKHRVCCECGVLYTTLQKKLNGIDAGIRMGVWTEDRAEIIRARINTCKGE